MAINTVVYKLWLNNNCYLIQKRQLLILTYNSYWVRRTRLDIHKNWRIINNCAWIWWYGSRGTGVVSECWVCGCSWRSRGCWTCRVPLNTWNPSTGWIVLYTAVHCDLSRMNNCVIHRICWTLGTWIWNSTKKNILRLQLLNSVHYFRIIQCITSEFSALC